MGISVALPTEGVDRNTSLACSWSRYTVALPTEGVDRNTNEDVLKSFNLVALPTEGVDRNQNLLNLLNTSDKSPSPRRAWIEMET